MEYLILFLIQFPFVIYAIYVTELSDSAHSPEYFRNLIDKDGIVRTYYALPGRHPLKLERAKVKCSDKNLYPYIDRIGRVFRTHIESKLATINNDNDLKILKHYVKNMQDIYHCIWIDDRRTLPLMGLNERKQDIYRLQPLCPSLCVENNEYVVNLEKCYGGDTLYERLVVCELNQNITAMLLSQTLYVYDKGKTPTLKEIYAEYIPDPFPNPNYDMNLYFGIYDRFNDEQKELHVNFIKRTGENECVNEQQMIRLAYTWSINVGISLCFLILVFHCLLAVQFTRKFIFLRGTISLKRKLKTLKKNYLTLLEEAEDQDRAQNKRHLSNSFKSSGTPYNTRNTIFSYATKQTNSY
ncbi:hypothetical protein SNEBB_002453 [Seison nebaliae]|nr:hypothetical protein SNEBB_002453 [Seison nebaliae]